MLRTRPIRNRLICGINTTIFSVVMVVTLLSLFAAESVLKPTLRNYHRNNVELPAATHSVRLYAADYSDAMRIKVTRDSKVLYGERLVDPIDVKLRILQDLSRGSEKKVYLLVDKWAKYSVVEDVLNSIQAAGIENIAFLAQQPNL